MSGGPVFNEAGHVIGVVSTGLVGGGIGTATCFAGWNVAEVTFRMLDSLNPGWIRCWCGFDADDKIVCYEPEKELLEPLLTEGKAVEIGAAVLNPVTGDYMLIE